MHGRWRIDGTGLLFAVGAPIGGLVCVVASTALTAFGPDTLTDVWAGRALLGLLGVAGYCLALFTQLRYLNLLVFFGAFFALFIGMNSITESVEERVFHQRGEITTCTVRGVDTRVQTTMDSEGRTTTDVYYDYTLACADLRVQEMTTGSRVAEQGDRIEVYHDPADRLTPRPASSIGDPRSSLKSGAALFGLGIMMRLLYELGIPPFRFGHKMGALWRSRLRQWPCPRRRRGEPPR